MKADITLKGVSIIIGITISVGGILLGMLDLYISHKLSDIRELQTANGAKLNMLIEERLVKMERTNLYLRMEKTLKMSASDLENYSIDRYIKNSDEEPEPSEKK